MVEVEVQGFQSIKHQKVTIDGFTVLVGRSNLGKSAFARAIRYALSGAPGSDFVRHRPDCERRKGRKKCKCSAVVRIKTANMEIFWEKGDAVNRYEVTRLGESEPTVYTKVGQGPPDFLQPEFAPVKVGSDGMELIQVSEQFNPIFLLNQSGTVVADVLSNVARLDEINVAMAEAAKDRKSDVSTRKLREKDILSLDKRLKGYTGLDETLDDVDRLDKDYESIQEVRGKLSQLDGFISRAKTLSISLKSLRRALQPPEPDVEGFSSASDRAFLLHRFYEALAVRAVTVRRLRGVDKVALPDAVPVERALDRAVRIDRWIDRVREVRYRMDRWKGLELTLPDPDPLRNAAEKAGNIDSLTRRHESLMASFERVRASLGESEKEKQEVLEEINDLGVCPTCSQSIEAGRCLHLEDS